MAHRSPAKQEAHDKGVLAAARELDREGWSVQADPIPDHKWDRPPVIAGHRPDVYAKKRGGTRIVEFETDPEDDHDQHKAFRRSAGQTAANFYGRIVDSAGRRQNTFE